VARQDRAAGGDRVEVNSQTRIPTSLSRRNCETYFDRLACVRAAIGANAQKKPNVVIMLADNVGYGDIGAYGAGEVRGMPTPRIDSIAAQGIATDAVPGGTGLHTLARGADDNVRRGTAFPRSSISRRTSAKR
jgi:hypothetical protein